MYMISQIKAGFFSAALTSQNELLLWGSMGTDLGSFQSPQKLYLDDIRFVDISMSKSQDSFMVALD
jgi:hypothetical protein